MHRHLGIGHRRVVLASAIFAMLLAGWGAEPAAAGPLVALPGKLGVSATGASTYTVPIVVPPGTAGMVPNIALDYSSQSGDGFVGWQWSLDGFAAITRCSRAVKEDSVKGGVNYDSNDRFCLNGQRLILISGTYGADSSQYRTELESFTKIIAHGTAGSGPSWFELHTKSGLTLELGNTTDSRALAVGTSTARLWNIDKITDTKGNYLTYTYTNDTTNGQIYPTRIDYTGNAGASLSTYASVQFTYNTSRSDVTPTYQAGSLIQTTVLLTHIKTYVGATLVYDYQLGYRAGTSILHSRLTSVTLCDGAGTTCLPATTFTWQGGSGLPTLTGTSNSLAQGTSLFPGDFDGDGLTDVLVTGGSNCGVSLGSNSGSFSTSSIGADFNLWEIESGHYSSMWTEAYTPCFGSALSQGARVATDFNGDGFSDVPVTQNHAASTPYQHILINDQAGSLVEASSFGSAAPSAIADFNGDGLADILAKISPTGSYQIDTSIGDGTFSGGSSISSSLSILVGDFDGDGCADMLQSGTSRSIVYSCNPATSTASLSTWSGAHLVLGDFNGDGKTDILVTYTAAAGTLYLSTGTGVTSTSFSVPSDWGKYTIVVGDWNGDGKDDLALMAAGGTGMYTHGTDHQIWLSTGSGFSSQTTISNSSSSDTTEKAIVADWNNDGAGDIWLQRPSGDAIYTFAYAPEVITGIDNGVGATTTVAYDRINKNGSLYSKGTATFPQVAYDGPMYVVSQISSANGIGGSFVQTYAYSGAFGNAGAYYYSRSSGGSPAYSFSGVGSGTSGPALFGFGQIAVTDSQTGIVTTTNYRTDFPYAGLVSSQTSVTTNTRYGCTSGTTVHSVTNTYGVTPATTSPAPYFVSLTESVESGHNCDNTAIPEITTDYTYDSYGVPTQISTTIRMSGSVSSTSVTSNTVSDDTTNWLFLVTSTNTVNTIASTPITRTTDITYQSGTNIINHVTNESGNGTLELNIAYTLDSFGNRTVATVSGANVSSRSTSATYDSAGRFVVTYTNEASQPQYYTWNADHGTMATHTDLNGHVTSFGYDTLGRMSSESDPNGVSHTFATLYCSPYNGSSTSCLTNAAFYSTASTYGAVSGHAAPDTSVYFDSLSRPLRYTTQAFNSDGVDTDIQYDSAGNVLKASRPFDPTAGGSAHWTTYAYDDLGRVITVTAPNSGVTSYAYSGLATTITDPLSHVTTVTRNPQGLTASVVDALSHTTSYVYDAFGDVLTVTDPSSNVVTNTYDIRGNKLTTSDPDLGLSTHKWTYTYNALGDVLTQVDGKSQTATLTYDALRRVTQRSESGVVANWVYDGATNGVGMLQKACTSASSNTTCTSATNTTTYTYDSLSRPSTTTINVDSTNHVYTTTYDSNVGQIATVAYPSGLTAKNFYNAVGFLCRITDNGGSHSCTSTSDSHVLWTMGSGDAENHILTQTAGNAAFTTTLTYDANTGLLTNVRAGPSDSVAQFDYTYDLIGDLTYRSDNYKSVYEKFCYDALNRLVNSATGSTTPSLCTSTGSGIASKTLTYDQLGDIVTKNDVGTYSYPTAGSARPHAVSSITGTVNGVTNPSYSYDDNGNLTSGAGRTLTYTAFNSTASLVQGSSALCLFYDSNHARIKMEARSTSCSGTLISTTTYLGDPASGTMSEKVVSGVSTTWHDFIVAGGGIVAERFCTGASPCSSGATFSYFVLDHLGSSAVLTNSSGTVTERNSYDAWGRRRNNDGTDNSACSITSGTSRGFTGHEMLDSVCEVNANARLYDPTLGRFMSADRFVQSPGDGQSYNRYSYVSNGPLSATDPSGWLAHQPDAPIYSKSGGPGGFNADVGTETVVVPGLQILPQLLSSGDGWFSAALLQLSGANGTGFGFDLDGVTGPIETVVVTAERYITKLRLPKLPPPSLRLRAVNPLSMGNGCNSNMAEFGRFVMSVGKAGKDASGPVAFLGGTMAIGGWAAAGGNPEGAAPGLVVADTAGAFYLGSGVVEGIGGLMFMSATGDYRPGLRSTLGTIAGDRIAPPIDPPNDTAMERLIALGVNWAAGPDTCN